jgi:hypothetical protein
LTYISYDLHDGYFIILSIIPPLKDKKSNCQKYW